MKAGWGFVEDIHNPVNEMLMLQGLGLMSSSPDHRGIIKCEILSEINHDEDRDYKTVHKMEFLEMEYTLENLLAEVDKFLEIWNSPLAKALRED